MPVNMLVYSNPGVGKTSFAVAKCKDFKLVDTENSSAHIDGLNDTNRVHLKSLAQLNQVIEDVQKGQVKTVIIDTVDQLIEDVMKEDLKRQGFKVNARPDVLSMDGYQVAKNKLMKLVRILRDMNANLLLTAHASFQESPEGGNKWMVQLPSNWAKDVIAHMDVVGYMKSVVIEDGQRIVRAYFQPTAQYDAKARGKLNIVSGEHKAILPEYMDNACFQDIINLYNPISQPPAPEKKQEDNKK